MTIDSILIANRGEIACRIARTAKAMGIRTIAIYTEPDADGLHVTSCDEAISLGQEPSGYLHHQKVINAAMQSGTQAIHPGYGFLSESAEFAKAVGDADLIFIGPPVKSLEMAASKAKAKAIAKQAGVPLMPGYLGADQTVQILTEQAGKIGYPVVLKASLGGGGRGMRVVASADDMAQAIESAKREALAGFGDDHLIIEKFLDHARHVEVQIMADKHGNVVAIGDRDCSLQRRNQKIVEEAPSDLDDSTRERLFDAAESLAKAMNYVGAGTVEFLFQDGEFYFIEVNARLQVEHPVTEQVTGLDLVALQIDVAAGRELTMERPTPNGHSIECRLNAEIPQQGFAAATGQVGLFTVPQETLARIDTSMYDGAIISHHYDSMVGKIVCHGRDRPEAQRKMKAALGNLVCLGLPTNQRFLRQLMDDEVFGANAHYTGYVEAKVTPRPLSQDLLAEALLACSIIRMERKPSNTLVPGLAPLWRVSGDGLFCHEVKVGEKLFTVTLTRCNDTFSAHIAELDTSASARVKAMTCQSLRLESENRTLDLPFVASDTSIDLHYPLDGPVTIELSPRFPDTSQQLAPGDHLAPMPGEVLKVLVVTAQEVAPGQPLVVLSSMKTEVTISAAEAGNVGRILVKPGDTVDVGTLLLELEVEG